MIARRLVLVALLAHPYAASAADAAASTPRKAVHAAVPAANFLVEWRIQPVNAAPANGAVVIGTRDAATGTSGFGAELVSLVQEHCFYQLEAPIERVAGWDTPYPHAQEWAYFPGPDRVGAAFKRAMEK